MANWPPALTAKRMACREAVVLLAVLLLALPQTQSFPNCCRRRKCSCKLYQLLHGAGNHAAGILTLGKRGSELAGPFSSTDRRLLIASREEDEDDRSRELGDPQPVPWPGPASVQESSLQKVLSLCSRLFDHFLRCLALGIAEGFQQSDCDYYAKLCVGLTSGT